MHTSTVTRPSLIAAVRAALESSDAVDAAWEGGSAAFGADDELSDLDVVAVVADDAVAAMFERVQAALDALSPIELRVPMPASAGFAQTFYRLRDAGEFLVLDLVLFRRSDPLLFREVELHGRGRTWFDRRGVLVERHLDLAKDAEQARERVPALADSFELFQHLVTKMRRRGRPAEALAFYHAFTWRPLIEAVRLLHDPKTRIFGPRYLRRDLPAAACDRIEALGFVRDLDHLGSQHAAARAWFARCMARLRAEGPGSGLPADNGDPPQNRPSLSEPSP